MKKNCFLFFSIAAILIACSRPVMDIQIKDMGSDNPYGLSLQEAQNNLESFMDLAFNATKNGISKRTIKNGFLLKLETKANDEQVPPIYVFNFAEEKGFALVGGDVRIPSVLCVVDDGNLKEGEKIDISGPDILLANIDTYCRMQMGLPVTDADGVVHYSDEYGYAPLDLDGSSKDLSIEMEIVGSYGEILACNWNQGSPFNELCYASPGVHAPAGCVPIAVGQIMYYYGKDATYNNIDYDWDVMHYVYNASSCPSNTTAWSQVQHLIAALGEPANLNVSYGVNGSGAFRSNVPRTFENFGYYSGGSFVSFTSGGLISGLEYGPVLMAGNSHRRVVLNEAGEEIEFLGYTHGHEWVVDRVLEVSVTFPGLQFQQMRNYCHCNWGWGGYHDGYFLMGVFNSNSPTQIDEEESNGLKSTSETKSVTVDIGTNYYYQYNIEMNCGIRPYNLSL